MNTKNNKRRRDSIEAIEKAFVALLQERELKEITVTDRATAYALLVNDPTLCITAPPMPPFLAAQLGLVQRPCFDTTLYRDLLVCRKDYRLTAADEAFLRALKGTARAIKGNE